MMVPSRSVTRNTASLAVLFAPAMKLSASVGRYGCGMRAVFSAMRRSLASAATVFASSKSGARRASRLVSRTGILPSLKVSLGIASSRVMAQAPVNRRGRRRKGRGGGRSPRPPLREPVSSPAGSDFGGPADLDFVHRLLGHSLRHRKYRYEFAAFFFGSEPNLSINQREEGVILADAYVTACMPSRTALARNDITRETNLAAGLLEAEPPARAVATVPGRSACFLVSHRYSLEFLGLLHRFRDGIISLLLATYAAASPSGLSAFGFASRFGRGGGVSDGFLPSVRISVMRTTENSCR